MAMVVQHNAQAQLALGELNKNISKVGELLGKVSSGQKIVGAKDDSAQFAISELMRVKIRALDQANQNVQNGSALLKSAEAGIQQQIDIVRTIREKVIDADNDTNTEEDRKIIQKELNQFYDQIDQTAYYTDYNSKKILLGDTYWKSLVGYSEASSVVTDEASVMDVIPNVPGLERLDEIDGPFDIFTEYGEYKATAKLLTGVSEEHEVNFIDGAPGTPKELTIDLSGYTINQLKSQNTGFRIRAVETGDGTRTADFVLTTNNSLNFAMSADWVSSTDSATYYNGITTVNISACNSVADVANVLANSISSVFGSNYIASSTASGNVITLVSANNGSASNSMMARGYTAPAASSPDVTVSYDTGSTTGKVNSSNGQMKGGKNSSGKPNTGDPDMKYVPPETASLGPIDISGISTPSGITINGYYTSYLEFKNDSSSLTYDSSRGVYTVGKNATVTNQQVDSTKMALTLSGGKLSFTATEAGATANSYSISDGYQIRTETPTGTYTYTAAVTASTAAVTTTVDGADDGGDAYWDIDLSNYSAGDIENFIDDLSGKTMRYYSPSPSSNTSYIEMNKQFYDSADETSMDYINTGGVGFDLDLVRQDVENGMSIAESFGTRFKSYYGSSYVQLLDSSGNEVTDTSETATVRINSRRKGAKGNDDTLSMWTTEYRHYDVKFGEWFDANPTVNIPQDLDGKGFRWYCATDANQWFNIVFSAIESDTERPKSGTKDMDIKTIEINVAGVTDAASLVEAIYDQAMPILTGDDPNYNHHHRLAIDKDNGILTVYDRRNWNVNIEGYDYQQMGAKITDGVADNIVRVKKDLLERRLVIHDTDKASMHFVAHIPDMRLDSIFGIMPDYGKDSIRDYSLNSKDDRMSLLDIVDTGVNYLLDAAVIVGAQNARLEHDQQNLVTEVENVIASESTIRDADMAKEMTEYTKMNVLQQSAQAMLAQANQNSSGVLSLLQ